MSRESNESKFREPEDPTKSEVQKNRISKAGDISELDWIFHLSSGTRDVVAALKPAKGAQERMPPEGHHSELYAYFALELCQKLMTMTDDDFERLGIL
ncbi:hypothetical protein AMELA_G00079320 [Ameiurus melas]|uniref:Uncharacterized protein n=1 Tax=Ameiurus melas TaxID=219545 RepID=A0A7J6B384_AMEME|nr:hypothetical protein AMELA_G00079320 [Ameiurus melas]